MLQQEIYDLIIIGAGPAGLTASIYASCYHLNHLVIAEVLGGQLQFAPDILNYPGFEDISGKELTKRLENQVKKRGGKIILQHVTEIKKDQNIGGFRIKTKEGEDYLAKTLIIATGSERKKLNVKGENSYTGRGVYYCATCGRQDYLGKVCVVVGGGNSAVQAAVELSQAAKKVYIIYRGTELRGDPIWLDQIGRSKKIETIFQTIVKEIIGDGKSVTAAKLEDLTSRNEQILDTDKIFIEIGGVPGTTLVIPLGVETDEGGFIQVNSSLETTVPGIFAAGDIVKYGLSIEQISSAVGLGSRAAFSAFSYLKKENAPTVWGKSQIKR